MATRKPADHVAAIKSAATLKINKAGGRGGKNAKVRNQVLKNKNKFSIPRLLKVFG